MGYWWDILQLNIQGGAPVSKFSENGVILADLSKYLGDAFRTFGDIGG